jgi:hypothetical protein
MSEPAPSQPRKGKLHRLHPDDEAALAKAGPDDVVELDADQAEAYLLWLETGDGSDPCKDASSK